MNSTRVSNGAHLPHDFWFYHFTLLSFYFFSRYSSQWCFTTCRHLIQHCSIWWYLYRYDIHSNCAVIYMSFTSGLWYIFFTSESFKFTIINIMEVRNFSIVSIQFSKTTITILEIVITYLTVMDFNFACCTNKLCKLNSDWYLISGFICYHLN